MEVCVDSIESAVNAAQGGAIRLELCSALSEGGLTPSPGTLQVIKTILNIPVYVMLRPRTGQDFCYSEDEVRAMKIDADILKKSGADGFVFGALKDGRVDVAVCQDILRRIAPHPATFHRAFDVSSDRCADLETIIGLGFKRILTSGGKDTAEKGVDIIKELISRAGDRIIIMPGAGITKNNVEHILNTTSATEFHGSAKCNDGEYVRTSRELVTQMVQISNQILKKPL